MASGPFSSDKGFSAELLMFEGGTPLGGTYTPAMAAGSKGTVTVKFTTDLDGTIALPGEPAQPIKRFTAYDISKRFMQNSGRFVNETAYSPGEMRHTDYEFFMLNGEFYLKSRAVLTSESEKYASRSLRTVNCIYSGMYEPMGRAVYSTGDYACTAIDEYTDVNTQKTYNSQSQWEGKYRTTDLTVDKWGIFSGVFQLLPYQDGVYRYGEMLHMGGQSIR